MPLPRFTGISLPVEPDISSSNPFDDFDDFVSAPLISSVIGQNQITTPQNVISRQEEAKFPSFTLSLTPKIS